MASQSNNRVLAIKSKFEHLNSEEDDSLSKQRIPIATKSHLYKQETELNCTQKHLPNKTNDFKETELLPIVSVGSLKVQDEQTALINPKLDSSSEEPLLTPNSSYLYTNSDLDKSPMKQLLSRKLSDSSKKLQRSHAFRRDKSEKMCSAAKHHNSFNCKSDTNAFVDKAIEKANVSDFHEDRIKNEEFVVNNDSTELAFDSIPDKNVPKHILDQYAKVLKPKKPPVTTPSVTIPPVTIPPVATSPVTTPPLHTPPVTTPPLHTPPVTTPPPVATSPVESKVDSMTDSGVSSETENQEECMEKMSRFKQIKAQFETASKTDFTVNERVDDDKLNRSNLDVMAHNNLSCSSETIKLEHMNPHILLTDTLKRALKQPLPVGPPPKKPPRTFQTSPAPERVAESQKRKDTKQMLQKLEQVLHQREGKNTPPKNNMENADTKDVHYLCTEIIDITQRVLLPNTQKSDSIVKCFNSLNCGLRPTKSTLSLPYTCRNSDSSNMNSPPNVCCASSANCIDKPMENRHKFSTFFAAKPEDTHMSGQFQHHMICKNNNNVEPIEHIYDEPYIDENDRRNFKSLARKSLQPEVLNSIREMDIEADNENAYSSLKFNGLQSRSMENLRMHNYLQMEEKIYDDPSHPSRSPSPEFYTSNPRRNFESLRLNFEKPKPIISEKPRPLLKGLSDSKIRTSKSTHNLSESYLTAKNYLEKFSTDLIAAKKCDAAPPSEMTLSPLKKKNQHQLDVDRENLNRLMNEIYETVSAACRMDDQQKPTKFPLDHTDGTSSEDSVKLTRCLTEKRKNYVRRVSSRSGCLDNSVKNRYRHQTTECSYRIDKSENHYATFRSWKNFRQENIMTARRDSTDSKINLTDSKGNLLSMKDEFSNMDLDNISLDYKAGSLDLELPFEPRERALFDICLLVGLNFMTGETYIKNVFPSQVKVPPHIGNLIFPERLNVEEDGKPEYDLDGSRTQCYSLVLTNEKGERNFGYCRRVLPEGANYCLPLCYCIIGRYRAPGFYYKVLQEIESQHGSSETDINLLLQQLIDFEFPNPGEELHINYNTHTSNLRKCYRNSVNLGDILKSKTLQTKSSSSEKLLASSTIPEFYDIENNNRKNLFLNVDTPRSKVLKRPIEPRMDEDNLAVLLDSLGPSLLVKVFGSLLLERKIVFISDSLSQLSSCMEALQSILYPFVWQQPLISTIPGELRKDILEAPLPILAGMLKRPNDNTDYNEDIQFLEGMLIDLSHTSPKVIFYQGDESTILPTVFHKTLKTTLQMELSKTHKDPEVEGTRNVMISEAFLRFFVDILSDFWNYFTIGEVKENVMGKGDISFNRESFIKDAPSKQTDFLEWFTETAMFNHFIENMAPCYTIRQHTTLPIDYTAISGIVDVPLPNFYQLFDERVMHKLSTSKKTMKSDKSDNPGKNNYKNAMNNKIKNLRSKLRDLVN